MGEGALVIGDAAGLAYSQSGEGIRPAVESALMAAETIVGAASVYRLEQLTSYRDRLTARFGPRHSRSVSEYLPGGLKSAMARVLMANSWFTRRVVLDGWFLHAGVAPLAFAADVAEDATRIASAA